MRKYSYYLINAITLYRLLAAPVLVVLLLYRETGIFKWLLAFSFFTDMIDGSLARKYKVTSLFGSRMDSLADDLTVAAGIAGLASPAFVLCHPHHHGHRSDRRDHSGVHAARMEDRCERHLLDTERTETAAASLKQLVTRMFT